MDVIDMYEYYRMQHGNSDDSHFDYCDHDDFSNSNNHLDEIYYCKDYGTPYVERNISSDLNKVLFYFNEYLNRLEELKKITIRFELHKEFFGFKAHSLTDYSIIILPTVSDNCRWVYNTNLSLEAFNTDRYVQISSHIDLSNELDNLLFSLLHEVGHCLHTSSSNMSLDDYFSIYNNCRFFDDLRGVCNDCCVEKKQKICNYYCEISADDFAFKHITSLKQFILEQISKSKSTKE